MGIIIKIFVTLLCVDAFFTIERIINRINNKNER